MYQQVVPYQTKLWHSHPFQYDCTVIHSASTNTPNSVQVNNLVFPKIFKLDYLHARSKVILDKAPAIESPKLLQN